VNGEADVVTIVTFTNGVHLVRPAGDGDYWRDIAIRLAARADTLLKKPALDRTPADIDTAGTLIADAKIAALSAYAPGTDEAVLLDQIIEPIAQTWADLKEGRNS